MNASLRHLLGLGGWNEGVLSHDGANRRNMLLLSQLRWLAVACLRHHHQWSVF